MANNDNYQYVTLSHRWGSPEPPKLSRFDYGPNQAGKIYIKALEEGKPISDLPKTFRDTILIVQTCGLKYLWIDSLCIFQDKDASLENQDWKNEVSKMADIYSGGVFNIAATRGQNSDAGLFSAQRDISLPVVRLSSGQAIILWQDPYYSFGREVTRSELLARGWVYQEVLFTPANLFCTTDEIWWSCYDISCSETFPRGAKRVDKDTLLSYDDIFRYRRAKIMNSTGPLNAWTGILGGYPATSVTVPSDRLVAIEGIANNIRIRYANQLQDTVYHSGIWFSDDLQRCLRQLFWAGCPLDNARKRPLNTYAAMGSVPSWSPVSYQGLIGFQWKPHDDVISLLPLEFVKVGNDTYGCAAGREFCVVHLRGALFNVKIAWFECGRPHPNIVFKAIDQVLEGAVVWDRVYEAHELNNTTVLWFRFDDRYIEGLLLKTVDGLLPCSQGRILWERCGSFVWYFPEGRDSVKHWWRDLGFERYGITLNDSGDFEKDVSAQVDLEDIYLV